MEPFDAAPAPLQSQEADHSPPMFLVERSQKAINSSMFLRCRTVRMAAAFQTRATMNVLFPGFHLLNFETLPYE
jgi:hypothetical protein